MRPDDPHWEALARDEFVLPRCRRCRRWIWPVESRCSACGVEDVGWEALAPEGEVYSWTVCRQAFSPAWEPLVPYTTLVVTLAGSGGRRMLGLFLGDPADLEIGARVEGVIVGPRPETQGLHAMRWQMATSEAVAR